MPSEPGFDRRAPGLESLKPGGPSLEWTADFAPEPGMGVDSRPPGPANSTSKPWGPHFPRLARPHSESGATGSWKFEHRN